jgi:NADH:ubiquinone oxidoreductase subunit E
MSEMTDLTITICMGSSCFSRGNNRNIEVIQEYLGARSMGKMVQLKGHLCEGLCKAGPNIILADKPYSEVDPVTLMGLLNYHLTPANREKP